MSKFKLSYGFVPMPEDIWKENLDLSLSEFRLLGYLLMQVRFGQEVESYSDDELLKGIFDAQGKRKDRGCGLSLNSLKQARTDLNNRDWLIAKNISSDPSRPKWIYRLPLSKLDSYSPEVDSNPPSSDGNPPKVDRCNKEVEVTKREEPNQDNPSFKEGFYLSSEESNGKSKNHKRVLEIILPEWLPVEEWNGWLEMRVKMRKAATDLAKKYALEELDALRQSGQNIKEVIRRAISKNWLSFYAITNGNGNGNTNGFHNGQQSRTNGSGATGHLLDHLPSIEQIQERRKADDKRLEERRNARGM